MNRLLCTLALVGALAPSEYAFAVDPPAPPAISRRQAIKNCMSREMAADKTLSYIGATKVCMERVKSQTDGSTAANQTKQ